MWSKSVDEKQVCDVNGRQLVSIVKCMGMAHLTTHDKEQHALNLDLMAAVTEIAREALGWANNGGSKHEREIRDGHLVETLIGCNPVHYKEKEREREARLDLDTYDLNGKENE